MLVGFVMNLFIQINFLLWTMLTFSYANTISDWTFIEKSIGQSGENNIRGSNLFKKKLAGITNSTKKEFVDKSIAILSTISKDPDKLVLIDYFYIAKIFDWLSRNQGLYGERNFVHRIVENFLASPKSNRKSGHGVSGNNIIVMMFLKLMEYEDVKLAGQLLGMIQPGSITNVLKDNYLKGVAKYYRFLRDSDRMVKILNEIKDKNFVVKEQIRFAYDQGNFKKLYGEVQKVIKGKKSASDLKAIAAFHSGLASVTEKKYENAENYLKVISEVKKPFSKGLIKFLKLRISQAKNIKEAVPLASSLIEERSTFTSLSVDLLNIVEAMRTSFVSNDKNLFLKANGKLKTILSKTKDLNFYGPYIRLCESIGNNKFSIKKISNTELKKKLNGVKRILGAGYPDLAFLNSYI
jgi:hypothetical protein